MRIEIKTYEQLDKSQLYELLRLRSEVFVVEQECAYQDLDNKDQIAYHILGYENDKLLAYTRVFKAGDYLDKASIGRVLVAKDHRNRDLGKQIMQASIAAAEDLLNESEIALSAQTYLTKFYNDLGFKETGEEYLEDGIPHIKMIRN